MRKKAIAFMIGGLAVFASLNIMRFILKTSSISRITCNSFDEAIVQNCQSLMSAGISVLAILILMLYYKKEIQERED